MGRKPPVKNSANRVYQSARLKNGLGVVHYEMPHAQSVAVGVWAQAGGRYEKPELSGISHFVEHLLFKGTRRLSCEALKQQVEGVGGVLNGFTAEELTCYMAKVPKRHWRRAVSLLSTMCKDSRFAAEDVDKEREVILEEIRMYEDAPGQLVHDYFSQMLWPDHPLGALLSGTIESVRRIQRSDLVAYWRRMYQSRSLLIATAGAVEFQAVVQAAEDGLGRMSGKAPQRFEKAPRARRGPQVRIWRKETEQTHLCLGTYAVSRHHPDRFVLELLHVLLGANMSSRLFREVREKRGLAYEINTQIKRFSDTGAFVVSAGCDTAKLSATIETIVRELKRIGRDLVPASELKRAKDYYAGQLVIGLEDTMDHMLWMGEQSLMTGHIADPERLLERVTKVTPSDIRRVASTLFTTTKIHAAIVGPVGKKEAARLSSLCRIR